MQACCKDPKSHTGTKKTTKKTYSYDLAHAPIFIYSTFTLYYKRILQKPAMWVDNNSQNEREREKCNNMLAQDTNSVKSGSDLLLSKEKNSDELKKRTKEEQQQQQQKTTQM